MVVRIGVDVGGTNIKIVAVTAAGEVLARVTEETADQAVVDWGGRIRAQIAAIEEQFGIEIDLGDADPDEFLTVNGLAQCASRSAQSSAASNDA